MAIETDSIVIFYFTVVLDTEDKIKVLAFWQRHVSALSLMCIFSVIPGEELVLEKPVCLIIITYPCKPHLLNKTVLKQPESNFHPAFSLRGVSSNKGNPKLPQCPFYLRVCLLSVYIVVESSMSCGLKMACLVHIQTHKQPLSLNSASDDMHIGKRGVLWEKTGIGYLIGSIVYHSYQPPLLGYIGKPQVL